MKVKKVPSYLLQILLTIGASLIIGFLSFSGMYILLPLLPIALGAFALSVAYEGEIYLQNIKGALNKLFKRDYLKRFLANQYLLETLSADNSPLATKACPQFFKDYEIQLQLLGKFAHKRLNKTDKARKKQIEKELKTMEKWFALQLFSSSQETLPDDLRQWFRNNKQDEWQALLKKRQVIFHGVKLFSVLASVFMGMGTTYLLTEAFAVIPFFAAISMTLLPPLIAPMAIIAGAAYGLLIYNAITDMINNDTLRNWYTKIRNDLKQGFTLRNILIASSTIFLFALAVALTFCTAGTWWTIVKNNRPIFAWMGRLPGFIMKVASPSVNGLSQFTFILQNTIESLEMVYNAIKKTGKAIAHQLTTNENLLQRINPARLILKLTLTPLRLLFFLGHLVSIGVTADKVPRIPAILSALLGIISEGFEDMHYFIDFLHEHEHEHDHGTQQLLQERFSSGHGHDHNTDIPTRLLRLIFLPVFLLAAAWDTWASQIKIERLGIQPIKPLTFKAAWNKVWSKENAPQEIEAVEIEENADKPSKDWDIQYAVYSIEHYIEKHLKNAVSAQAKIADLNDLKTRIRKLSNPEQQLTVQGLIQAEIKDKNKSYNVHRLFGTGNTRTQDFLETLGSQVAPGA
ncbi:hypothetical protein [Legionella fairfieldensis]|uniref:hypothetical protein n=1 Tax=Legionella fairfieldensis TaxID=45064 RepID=UPI00048B8AA5|nr:hypothetical protein [Legionella fairfieldensis]